MQSSNFFELYNYKEKKILLKGSAISWFVSCIPWVVLLSSDLDELLQELHSLVERCAHENLRHDPLLDLVAALEENGQRHRVASAGRTAECVVYQFLLHVEKEDKKKCLMPLSKLFLWFQNQISGQIERNSRVFVCTSWMDLKSVQSRCVRAAATSQVLIPKSRTGLLLSSALSVKGGYKHKGKLSCPLEKKSLSDKINHNTLSKVWSAKTGISSFKHEEHLLRTQSIYEVLKMQMIEEFAQLVIRVMRRWYPVRLRTGWMHEFSCKLLNLQSSILPWWRRPELDWAFLACS